MSAYHRNREAVPHTCRFEGEMSAPGNDSIHIEGGTVIAMDNL